MIVKAANKMKTAAKEEAAEEEVVPTSEDYLKIRDLLAAQTPPAETVKTDSTFTEK